MTSGRGVDAAPPPSSRAERRRATGVVRYDLRPLLADVTVAATEAIGHRGVRGRDSTRSAAPGRPEEVVAALADLAGHAAPGRSIVARAAVLLADELDADSTTAARRTHRGRD